MTVLRCSDASLHAEEPLGATATHAERWLLVEVPGAWPRDVGDAAALPERARDAVGAWLDATPRSRLLFLRRPERTADRLSAYVVAAPESPADAEVRKLELSSHEDLADADLAADGDLAGAPLVLVCGHGSRDACCARLGTPVFGALASGPPGVEVWLSSHHGGHRFAANVLVLPAGIHLGRLDPATAPRAVADAVAGRVDLERYRGRTCYAPEVQAAEHAVREHTGLLDLGDLRLAAVDDGTVRFRGSDGAEHVVEVERLPGPFVPASCGAEPEPQDVLRGRVV